MIFSIRVEKMASKTATNIDEAFSCRSVTDVKGGVSVIPQRERSLFVEDTIFSSGMLSNKSAETQHNRDQD